MVEFIVCIFTPLSLFFIPISSWLHVSNDTFTCNNYMIQSNWGQPWSSIPHSTVSAATCHPCYTYVHAKPRHLLTISRLTAFTLAAEVLSPPPTALFTYGLYPSKYIKVGGGLRFSNSYSWCPTHHAMRIANIWICEWSCHLLLKCTLCSSSSSIL